MDLDRTDFVYTPNYCEENVYKLLEKLRSRNSQTLFHVVFISNDQKSVAIFGQSAGDAQNNHVVVWDYHVVLIGIEGDECMVYDFDHISSLPVTFNAYREHGLLSNDLLSQDFHRYYRVIGADAYLDHFSSDRRHMKGPNGAWLAPPPSYHCIRSPRADSEHNLPRYWDMQNPVTDLLQLTSSLSRSKQFGVVLAEPVFFEVFSHCDQYSKLLP